MLRTSRLGVIVLLLSALIVGSTSQSDLYWASPIDGFFNETKWNIESTKPTSVDRAFLNATGSSHTITIVGTNMMKSLKIGRNELPISNVTLLFADSSTINATEAVISYPGSSMIVSGKSTRLVASTVSLYQSKFITLENSSITLRTSQTLAGSGSMLTLSKASELILSRCSLIVQQDSVVTVQQEALLGQIGPLTYDTIVYGAFQASGSFITFGGNITVFRTGSFTLQGTSVTIFNLNTNYIWNFIIESPNVLIERSKLTFFSVAGFCELLVHPAGVDPTPPEVEVIDSDISVQRLTVDGPGASMKVSNGSLLNVLNVTVSAGAFLDFSDSAFSTRFSPSNPNELYTNQLLVTGNSRMIITGADASFPTISTTIVEYQSSIQVSATGLFMFGLGRRVEIRHDSSLTISGRADIFSGIYPRYEGFNVYNGSIVRILGPRARFSHLFDCSFEFNSIVTISGSSLLACYGGLIVGNNSTVVIDNSRLEQSFGNISISQGSIISALNRSEIILGGSSISIDAASKIVLETGSRLAGVGSISGLVLNNGGSITYENASTTTNVYIQNLTQSSGSTFDTIVRANSSSTVVFGGTVRLGGSVLVNISADSNISANGILLINAQDSLEGDIPALRISLANGTTLQVAGDAGNNNPCGYSLQKREKSLFLVFSLSGCSTSSTLIPEQYSTPASAAVPASALGQAEQVFSSNVGAIAGGVIGGIFGAAIIAVIILFAVPFLRHRVQPFFFRSHDANPIDGDEQMELSSAQHPESATWLSTKPTATL